LLSYSKETALQGVLVLNGYNAVQSHSRSSRSVVIKSLYATSY